MSCVDVANHGQTIQAPNILSDRFSRDNLFRKTSPQDAIQQRQALMVVFSGAAQRPVCQQSAGNRP